MYKCKLTMDLTYNLNLKFDLCPLSFLLATEICWCFCMGHE